MKRKECSLIGALLLCCLVTVNPAVAQTWSQLAPVGPGPSTSQASGATNYDSTNDRLIVYLAEGSATPSQVWVLTNANGAGTPTWTQLLPTGTAPQSNGGATAVYLPSANQLVVYGGCSAACGVPLDTVFVLTHANGLGGVPAWVQRIPTSSVPRTMQTAVYDSATNRMITFGGNLGITGTDQNDTHVLASPSGASPAWTTLVTTGGPPGVREGTSSVYGAGQNRLIVFGGEQQVTCCSMFVDYNDVWVLTNANGTGGAPVWSQLTPQGSLPPPRRNHSAVYEPGVNAMYVFGGSSWSNTTQSYSILGDVWMLSNANGLGAAPPKWTQIGQLGTPPGATAFQGSGFDKVNRRIISYGGEDRNLLLNFLTYILDLNLP